MDHAIEIFNIIERGNTQAYKNCVDQLNINITNSNGSSLLHKAIECQCSEIALDLIQRSINVNIQDHKGQSCLHYLGFFPNPEIAEAIINNEGKLDLKDAYGNTPLWYAAFNARGKYELVELFMKYKANPFSMNHAGKTPFSFAAQIQDQNLIEIMSQNDSY